MGLSFAIVAVVVRLITYGRSFTLDNPSVNRLRAPAQKSGKAGTYTREAGFLAYYEICTMLKNGAKRTFLDDQKVPYLVLGDQWVGYEDLESIRIKAQFIKDMGYAGAMVWDLDLDDFGGNFCGQGRYPLIREIKRILS